MPRLANYRQYFLLLTLLVLSGCATKFPTPTSDAFTNTTEITAEQIFDRTFNVHGGGSLTDLNDVNVALSGKWKTLIKKIQPLVTDFNYRVDSQERLFPNNSGYISLYTGPSGTKKVVRSPATLEVYYNNEASEDSEVLSSTALTADAFHLFLLGPLALERWKNAFARLSDINENGTLFHRIHLTRKPGFGYSPEDQVVLWVNTDTGRTFRIQITLEGHSTTKGAHVEVDYLNYIHRGAYLFPSSFFERVNAPLSIDAHAWHLTGLDINRGSLFSDYLGSDGESLSRFPALPLSN